MPESTTTSQGEDGVSLKEALKESLSLPGWSLPLNALSQGSPLLVENDFLGRGAPFPNALEGGTSAEPTTLREICMLAYMNALTDKPEWYTKVFSDEICAKWKAEALATTDMSRKMVDWCIEEVKFKANMFEKTGSISVLDGDVCKSDTLASPELRKALIEAVKPLEEVDPVQLDWHPNSDNKVLDLVHPSLFPLIYGRSRILESGSTDLHDVMKRGNEGLVVPEIDKEQRLAILRASHRETNIHNSWSMNFQWLPCEVRVSDEKRVGITSYINNLHPEHHKPLYKAIEKVIASTIPLWDMTLNGLNRLEYLEPRISYGGKDEDDSSFEFTFPEEGRPQRKPGQDEDDFECDVMEWEAENQIYTQPEPDKFANRPSGVLPSDTTKGFSLSHQCAVQGLQVIVKLANIVLTPEKPSYEGGSWHVEGQLNEHIVATGIYYYDSDNVTESRLQFRKANSTAVEESWPYEQGELDFMPQIFGFKNNESTVQEIGDVVTKEGRLISFPNIYQHRVTPFQLQDPSKPGHRKILALFLVDPYIRIISTANIVPQQAHWWAMNPEALDRASRLPVELKEEIVGLVEKEGFPISMKTAKELRLELMQERSAFVDDHDRVFNSMEFDLCEH